MPAASWVSQVQILPEEPSLLYEIATTDKKHMIPRILCFFVVYILCFCHRTKSLNLTVAFWRFFSKNRVRTYVISFFAKLGDYVEKFESSQYSPIIAKDKKSTIFKKTREVVIRLIENGVKYFKAGGAIGFNTKAVYSC